jgi:hypothetical protein
MPIVKRILTPIVAAVILMGGLLACEREGPLERAGERVDRAAERAGDKAERAVD